MRRWSGRRMMVTWWGMFHGMQRRQRDGSLPDRQGRQSLEEMLAALPYNCDVGRKKGSKGHCMTWCGDKLQP